MTKSAVLEVTDKIEAGLKARRAGDDSRAERLWLEAADEASASNALLVADGLSALATSYRRSGNTQSQTHAEKLFLRSIEMRRRFLGENDLTLAVELNNLGMFLHGIERALEGIAYLEQAVTILDVQIVLSKENYADPYDNLAAILFEKGALERASVLCARALEIRDQTLGRLNPLSLLSLELLAEIREAINQDDANGRSARIEFAERSSLYAAQCTRNGNPTISQAILMQSRLGRNVTQDIVSTALRIMAGSHIRNRQL